MVSINLLGTVEFAKILMSVFVMLYAYLFLRRTKDDDDRLPWEFLFIASMFLFVVESVTGLQLFYGTFGQDFFTDFRRFTEFCFIAFLLYSFIYQHNRMVEQGKLLLERKKGDENIWETFKRKYLEAEEKAEKALGKEEGEDPEEEMKEELEEMDDDEELKKEEEEIEKILKEQEGQD